MESERENARLEILKIQKRNMISFLCIAPLGLAFIVTGIIAAVNIGNSSLTSFYIFLVLFGILAVVFIIALPFIVMQNKRVRVLVDKFAGPISDSDKALAKALENKWQVFYPDIKKWNFDFLGYFSEYEDFELTVSKICRDIYLGIKSEITGAHDRFLEIVYKDFRELQGKSELDNKTKEIIGVLFEILSLMEKNSYSLKSEHNEISTKKD